jgi:hypothetical protein
VVIIGLSGKPELNGSTGRTGKALSFDDHKELKEYYSVELDETSSLMDQDLQS